MLTEEKLNNLHKLNPEEIKQILLECVEYFGLTDMEEASKALSISKRRIYQLMNDSNSITIGSHKFPFINMI